MTRIKPLGVKYDETPYLDLLGSVPDSHLAERFGVSVGYICQLRKKYNIPPCFKKDETTKIKPDQLKLLGTLPDRQLAKQLNISTARIHQLRVKHDIAPYGKPKKIMKINKEDFLTFTNSRRWLYAVFYPVSFYYGIGGEDRYWVELSNGFGRDPEVLYHGADLDKAIGIYNKTVEYDSLLEV